MTPDEITQRYQAFDYAIRYLAPGVPPSTEEETDTVFALEVAPQELAKDARGKPLMFSTEAAAFNWRSAGGNTGPVLAFGPHTPDIEDAADFDAGDVEEYAEPWKNA